MMRSLLILVFFALSVCCLKAQTNIQAVKRAPLFIGNGKATWLPRTDLLPTAEVIEDLAKKLGVRQRNLDPFGISTFPREDDAPTVTEDEYRETPKVTLNQALQTLRVIGVNLSSKEFLIGGRRAAEGDVIELAFKGEVFLAQVTEIGPTELHFRDIKRDETGVLQHNIIPQLKMEPLKKISSQLESRLTPVEPAPPAKP